jgi:hypothetical protein
MLPYSRLFSQDANLSLFGFLIISTEIETANTDTLATNISIDINIKNLTRPDSDVCGLLH